MQEIIAEDGFIVVTTIQAPTRSMTAMAKVGLQCGMRMIVVGDRKTPVVEWPVDMDFLSISAQRGLKLDLPCLVPENHYSRKNIGYLAAISRGARVIFDTDDDNGPLRSWGRRELTVEARACDHLGWVNVYRWFTDEHIWPRGLPLGFARRNDPAWPVRPGTRVQAPVQQGLANGSPDVDAIWRLLLDKEIEFRDEGSVFLEKGAWCPFNSQSTWWFPEAYPLMYLPSHVSFRMTDIWRSLIAQRCLWEMNGGVAFHGPEMHQERNAHDLMRDFEQEIPGYLHNEAVRDALERVQLSSNTDDVCENLCRCYDALIAGTFIAEEERALVNAWIRDLEVVRRGRRIEEV